MKRILIDINVLLDVLMNRAEFYEASAEVLTFCVEERISGYISAAAVDTLYFIIRRTKSHLDAINLIKKLRTFLKVVPVNDKIIDLALTSDFEDLEDAIHYYAAIKANIEGIITRNKKDFKTTQIPVLTPDEFLQSSYIQR